jgi:tetratricopeptide (TPR) repeat protein
LAYVQTLARLRPDNDEALFRLIEAYQNAGRHEEAIALADEQLKRHPDNTDFYECKLRSYAEQANWPAMQTTLDLAFEQALTPDSLFDALSIIGSDLIKNGKPAHGGHCALRLIDIRPDSTSARALLVLSLRGLLSEDNYRDAVPMVERLVELMPDNARFAELLIACYQEIGNIEGQITLQRKLIENDPENAMGHYNLGVMLEQIGRSREAVGSYLKSCSLKPDFADPFLRASQNLLYLNNEADALAIIDQAISLFPDDAAIYAYKGMALNLQNEYRPAIVAFEKAQSLASFNEKDPLFHAAFYYSFGAACEQEGDDKQAETLLRKSLEANPDEHRARNYLAYMWAEDSVNLDEATLMVKEALAKDPHNAAYLDTYGWILYQQEQYELALTYLTRAWETLPHDSTVSDHLGDCLHKLKRTHQAIKWWKKSYELDPTNASVYNKLKLNGVEVSPPNESVKTSGS